VPLYEYQCGRCGRFEIIQKFSDAPLTACPTCGQEVQKLLSAPAIQFKGTGWYITDYARKSSGGDGGSAKGGAAADGGAAKDGGKDKPDAKTKTSGTGGSSTGSSDTSSAAKGGGSSSGST
jgi:putative FmdB family regulatory protein